MSKDTVCFEMFINWNEPLFYVRVYLMLLLLEIMHSPLLGKFPSKTLVKRLVEKTSKKEIYVALDEDARKQDAIKLSKFLMDYGIKHTY